MARVSGGSAWESNPAPPRQRGATDFEDREGHRAPFASWSGGRTQFDPNGNRDRGSKEYRRWTTSRSAGLRPRADPFPSVRA